MSGNENFDENSICKAFNILPNNLSNKETQLNSFNFFQNLHDYNDQLFHYDDNFNYNNLNFVAQGNQFPNLWNSDKQNPFFKDKSYSNSDLKIPSNNNALTQSNNDEENSNFLGRKTNRSQNNYIFEANNQTTKNGSETKGRNTKDSNQTIKKGKENNKIIKIKTFVINDYHNSINRLLAKRNLKLCDLNPIIKESINKNYNIELLSTTFKNIYLNTDISSKYKKSKWKNQNKKIINNIYDKRNENDTEIIQKLDLTLDEVLQIFVREKIDSLYDKIRNDLKKKNKSDYFIEEYLFGENSEEKKNGKNRGKKKIDKKRGIKDLCLCLKEWFEEKIPRKRKK